MPDDYFDIDYGYDEEYDETDYGYYTRKKIKAPSFLDYDYVEGEIYEDDYNWNHDESGDSGFVSDWF